jgi:hypothetical protein
VPNSSVHSTLDCVYRCITFLPLKKYNAPTTMPHLPWHPTTYLNSPAVMLLSEQILLLSWHTETQHHQKLRLKALQSNNRNSPLSLVPQPQWLCSA